MECCVCLEEMKIGYFMICNHDLCERCAYKIIEQNSVSDKYGENCFTTCPLCRNESMFKIRGRPVYYLDNMVQKHKSLCISIDTIINDPIVPYILVLYPDGFGCIIDPITRIIYDSIHKKVIGRLHFKKSKNCMQLWVTFHYKWYVCLYDYITCGTKQLRFY